MVAEVGNEVPLSKKVQCHPVPATEFSPGATDTQVTQVQPPHRCQWNGNLTVTAISYGEGSILRPCSVLGGLWTADPLGRGQKLLCEIAGEGNLIPSAEGNQEMGTQLTIIQLGLDPMCLSQELKCQV